MLHAQLRLHITKLTIADEAPALKSCKAALQTLEPPVLLSTKLHSGLEALLCCIEQLLAAGADIDMDLSWQAAAG